MSENGIRINKYLSEAGVCSRREADRLVDAGRVCIDGVTAVSGAKVCDGQTVTLDGRNISHILHLLLSLYNMPTMTAAYSQHQMPLYHNMHTLCMHRQNSIF